MYICVTSYIHKLCPRWVIMLQMTLSAWVSHRLYLNRCVSVIFIYIHVHLYIFIYIRIISCIHKWCSRWLSVHEWVTVSTSTGASLIYLYGVATISRMLKNIGLFCKRDLQKRPIFCKETYIFKHPTNRSHPIHIFVHLYIFTVYHTYTHHIVHDLWCISESLFVFQQVCLCYFHTCTYICIYSHISTLYHTYTNHIANEVLCIRESLFVFQQVNLCYIYIYIYVFIYIHICIYIVSHIYKSYRKWCVVQ